jgi:hypothetical protein
LGMHFGIVAVKAEVSQLMAAFVTAWPRHEPTARASLAGLEALDAWMRATQRQVTAAAGSVSNPGIDTFGFWQDGEWAVMLDPSYVQASDGRALAALSERFGLALAFIIETSGGCAFFDAFEQGRRVRRIQSIDGAVTSEGERLAQEAGLPAASYYRDETEQLQRAFGITLLEQLPADHPVIGTACIDRTDYGALKKTRQARAPGAVAAPARKRPWWRFW